MTVKELILQLEKFEYQTEVWIDTEFGLKSVDDIYEYNSEHLNTVIIQYKDQECLTTLKN